MHKHYLQLREYLLDVSETTFCNVKIFLECSTFEHRLRSILKESRKWEKFLNFLHFGVLKHTIFGAVKSHLQYESAIIQYKHLQVLKKLQKKISSNGLSSVRHT